MVVCGVGVVVTSRFVGYWFALFVVFFSFGGGGFGIVCFVKYGCFVYLTFDNSVVIFWIFC